MIGTKMSAVRLSEVNDSIVIHFETENEQINAYTLASILVSLADAAKSANSSINAGYNVEIVVTAVAPGSFRAAIKAIYDAKNNIFSTQTLQTIILGVLSSYIYSITLAPDNAPEKPPSITVNTDEVIIEYQGKMVIVPRDIHEAAQVISKNPKFTGAISKTLEAIEQDEKILGLGFVKDVKDKKPEIIIPREKLISAIIPTKDEPATRIIEEECSLLIMKAILENSRRKWEFTWRGIKISAPIRDDDFFNKFIAHTITIAPGDELKVRLAIKQVKSEINSIYINSSYEVIKVHEHVASPKQPPLTYPDTK